MDVGIEAIDERSTFDELLTRGKDFHRWTPLQFASRAGNQLVSAVPDAPRYVLCHIRAGSAVFVIDGMAMPVVTPAVVLLDESRRPEILHARDLQMTTLYFHPSLIDYAFAPDLIQSEQGWCSLKRHQDLFLLERFVAKQATERVTQLPVHVHERVKQSIDNATSEAQVQPDKYWTCRVRSFVIEALFQLRMLEPVPHSSVSTTAASPADDARSTRVMRAISFLQERYHSDFTLSEVACICFTNRTTLNAEFRNATGMTVRAYTIALRMKMAADMLRNTDLPVAEIMGRVGYENPSHFTRAFRATLGKSPRDYRNAQG
ncbi:MAG: AraC family transcriptional regulator [Rhodocyclaceae bacterium]